MWMRDSTCEWGIRVAFADVVERSEFFFVGPNFRTGKKKISIVRAHVPRHSLMGRDTTPEMKGRDTTPEMSEWRIRVAFALHLNIWMSHVSHTHSSSHSPVTRTNRLWHTYKSVMTQIWMIHSSRIWIACIHMNESCYTYKWVMSHIWMAHDTHMNVSYDLRLHCAYTWEWVMGHICMGQVWFPFLLRLYAWMSHVTHMHWPRHSCEPIILLCTCIALHLHI